MTPQARPPLDEELLPPGRRQSSSRSRTTTGSAAGLASAEVVLLGVSRTSKTPLSIYLGYLGWKATNVPLVEGNRASGGRSSSSTRPRIVGLTIDAGRLGRDPQRTPPDDGRRPQLTPISTGIYEDLEHAAAIHRRLGMARCSTVSEAFDRGGRASNRARRCELRAGGREKRAR